MLNHVIRSFDGVIIAQYRIDQGGVWQSPAWRCGQLDHVGSDATHSDSQGSTKWAP